MGKMKVLICIFACDPLEMSYLYLVQAYRHLMKAHLSLHICTVLPEPYYPLMKSEGYSFGVVRRSIPSALFVCPKPYLSTYWSDLIHSSYK